MFGCVSDNISSCVEENQIEVANEYKQSEQFNVSSLLQRLEPMSSNDALDLLRNAHVELPEPLPLQECLEKLRPQCEEFQHCGASVVNVSAVTKELEKKGMDFCEAKADGNCWFRACSQALYGTEEYHAQLRTALCSHMLKKLDAANNGADDFVNDDERRKWGWVTMAEAKNSLLQQSKRGISVDGGLYILESCKLWKIDMVVWRFNDITMTLEHVYPTLFESENTSMWRRWHTINHMTHERGWSPEVGERVAKHHNGQWRLATVSKIERILEQDMFTVMCEENGAPCDEGNEVFTDTVSIAHLHKVRILDDEGRQFSLRQDGHHFSSLLPGTPEARLQRWGVRLSARLNLDAAAVLNDFLEAEQKSPADVLLCRLRFTIKKHELVRQLKKRRKQTNCKTKKELLAQVRCIRTD